MAVIYSALIGIYDMASCTLGIGFTSRHLAFNSGGYGGIINKQTPRFEHLFNIVSIFFIKPLLKMIFFLGYILMTLG